MAWYDAGTVNVTLNSATVTGAGTQWVAGARQGEAFVGPDGRLYEVLNIASDTSLTLTRPYRGATQSAQPYALAPFQGYTKELADRAAELLRRYADAAALAEGAIQKTSIGSKYGADDGQILPAFAYGFGGRPDPYPHPSVNVPAPPGVYMCASDITDTPGGAGVLIREGARDESGANDCLLDRFNAVSGGQFWRTRSGSGQWSVWNESLTASNVSALLGLKTAAFADLIGDVGAGAVMQSGSNANGRWHRFQNGLQVCLSDITVYSGTAVQQPWIFPAAFADAQIFIDATLALGAGTDPRLAAVSNLYGRVDQNGATLCFTSPSDVTCRRVAIGRYK